MNDLAQWLRAQLDEDERIARAVPVDLGHQWSDPGPWVMAGSGGGGREAEVAKAADGLEMPLAEHVAHHIAAHDPARVLRETEAKRRLLDDYTVTARIRDEAATRIKAAGGHPDPKDLDEWDRAQREAAILEGPVRLAASVYDDRPGYQEAWRP